MRQRCASLHEAWSTTVDRVAAAPRLRAIPAPWTPTLGCLPRPPYLYKHGLYKFKYKLKNIQAKIAHHSEDIVKFIGLLPLARRSRGSTLGTSPAPRHSEDIVKFIVPPPAPGNRRIS